MFFRVILILFHFLMLNWLFIPFFMSHMNIPHVFFFNFFCCTGNSSFCSVFVWNKKWKIQNKCSTLHSMKICVILFHFWTPIFSESFPYILATVFLVCHCRSGCAMTITKRKCYGKRHIMSFVGCKNSCIGSRCITKPYQREHWVQLRARRYWMRAGRNASYNAVGTLKVHL